MEHSQDRPFDEIGGFLDRKIPRFYRVVFIGCLALALLTHLYILTNKLINHDDVDGLLSDCSFGLSSGRWLLKPLTELGGNFSSNWMDGLFASLFLALGVTLLIYVFGIRRYLPAFLVGGCMVAFPTVAATYTYMFCSSQYLFAMAMSALAAFLIRKERWPYLLAGVIALALAMGSYQGYFCLTAAALVAAMLMDTLRGRFEGRLKPFFLTALRYVGSLAGGMILYFVILKVCLAVTGTALTDYQGISSMGKLTLGELVKRIRYSYDYLTEYYFQNAIYHPWFPRLVVASAVLDAAAVVWIVWREKLYRSLWTLLMLAVLAVILPLASSLVNVMAGIGMVHQVMIYPVVVPLLLPVLLGSLIRFPEKVSSEEAAPSEDSAPSKKCVSGRGKRLRRWTALLLAVLLLATQLVFGYEFFFVTNRTYAYMDVSTRGAYAYFTKLTARLESTEGFTPESRVAFTGYASAPFYVPGTGVTGGLSGNDVLNFYSRWAFLSYYLLSTYHYCSPEELAAVTATEEFAQMPCYPAEGSIAVINGIITVKLS